LEQIVNEYLDFLTVYNIIPLINILEAFALYKKKDNTSLTAITMFWNAISLAEKFQKITFIPEENLKNNSNFKNLNEFQKEYLTKEKDRKEFFDNLYEDLFNKLVNICSDTRFDVRKSAINIFADIFVAKNSLISNEISLNIINDYFLTILEKSYSVFEDKLKLNRTNKNTTSDINNQLKTPKFSDNVGDIKIGDFKADQLKLPTKQKFDEASISKLIQPSAEEKEWEDTTILVIQATGKVIRSFMNFNTTNIKEKDIDYYKEKIFDNLIYKFTKIMRMTTPELASTILKTLQEIYYANSELFLKNFDLFWKVYDEMGKFITTDFFLNNNLSSMASSSKMVMNVLEILKEIFLKEKNFKIKEDLLKDYTLQNLLSYVTMLIKSSRNSEGLQIFTNPQRLLGDEKQIFEFVEKISKNLYDLDSQIIYCKFLSTFITFDLNDHHTEAHCRKALELFDIFFSNKDLDNNLIKEYSPKLIHQVKEISCLRSKNDYVQVLIKNNKTQMQLWHFASFQLIKMLASILCNNKKGTGNDNDNYNTNNYNTNNYISNYNTNINIEKDLISDDNTNNIVNMNEVWEATISCFETIFRQSEGGYKTITKTIMEELFKSCQEMEIQIINFIVNGLLPNSLKIPKEMQIKLLTLLDIGSNFDYNRYNTSNQSSTTSSNISRVCISNLFELCKFRSEDSLKKGKINILK
jgi:hypothetical protein